MVYTSLIGLNPIRTFIAPYGTGSVTFAVERLLVTQPSVSYTLARPYELSDDVLFTRTRDGIQPTFVAKQPCDTFRGPLTRIEDAVQNVRHFDPAATERRFRIALTDFDEVGFLSLIFERLTRNAPFTEVEMLSLQVDEVGAQLSSAKVDAAICRQPVPGACSQRVLREYYVCLLSDRHPRVGDSSNLEQYLAKRHIVVIRTSGHGIAKDVLETMQVQRRISLWVPYFPVLPRITPGIELLTVLLAQIAHRFVAEGGMHMLELPFALPPLDVSLHQHKGNECLAALDWFRAIIAETIIVAQC